MPRNRAYKPDDRFSDDMAPTFPTEDIVCKGCAFARPGLIGYKNAYCRMYEAGKPNEILFANAICQFMTEAAG